jgi:RNA polymerase sigma-70 factor (ECF subfamily)
MTTTYMTTDTLEAQRELIEWVRAAQQGDRAAFGRLFERYERRIFAIAMRRLGDYDEAAELVQDVFLQAMEKIVQLREPAAFAGWMRQITHRMAINRMTRRKRATAVEPETLAAVCEDTDGTPLTLALESERKAQVRAGLELLGNMDRETLEAFYVKGQSILEMSDAFEAPVGTIKRRLHTARKRLAVHVDAVAAV